MVNNKSNAHPNCSTWCWGGPRGSPASRWWCPARWRSSGPPAPCSQSGVSIVKLCTNHSAVLLLPVDHGGLARHGAVEVDHGDSLLIGPDHARLHHLHSQSQVSIIVSFNPVLPVQTRAPPTRRPTHSLHLLAGYWPSSTAQEDVNVHIKVM